MLPAVLPDTALVELEGFGQDSDPVGDASAVAWEETTSLNETPNYTDTKEIGTQGIWLKDKFIADACSITQEVLTTGLQPEQKHIAGETSTNSNSSTCEIGTTATGSPSAAPGSCVENDSRDNPTTVSTRFFTHIAKFCRPLL